MALALAGIGLDSPSHLASQEKPDRDPPPSTGVRVLGVVQDHDTGEPVFDAAVSLMSGPSGTRGRGTRVTNDEGRFLFLEVPPGSYLLSVTILGYRSMRDSIQVPAGEDLELILPLAVQPIRLRPIIVSQRRSPSPARRGFESRRRYRSGFVVTREEIVERRPRLLTDVLNRVPGGIVVPTPPHGYTLLLRGQCRPGIWLDGVEVPDVGSIDQLMSPHDVDLIEVYHGFELPVEFGVNPCGGVLIWTRTGPRVEREAGVESHGKGGNRWFVAVGFLLAFLVVR